MPRSQTEVVNANFSRGFITETGPLGYPENSCKDMNNLVLERNGSVRVRNGLVVPEWRNAQEISDNEPYSVHYWDNPANDGTSFVVIQVGSELRCLSTDGDYIGQDTITAGSYRQGLFSTDIRTVLNRPSFSALKSSQSRNQLFLTSPETGPFYLEYLPNGTRDNPDFEEQGATSEPFVQIVAIVPKYRDVFGLDDGLDVDERPVEDIPEHRYNLMNAGWPTRYINEFRRGRGGPSYPDYGGTEYPARADYFWLGYSLNPNDRDSTTEEFIGRNFYKFPVDTSPAPMGKYILDVFDPSRSEKSGIENLPERGKTAGPNAIGFFAGRAWYAGFNGGGFEDNVLFSNVLPFQSSVNYNEEKQAFVDTYAGQCYQKNDPTAREVNDLVDDDGGVITIPGLGTVMGMVSLKTVVIVVSDRGAWAISGGIDPFSANNYTVNKITTVGCVGKDSIVELEGSIMYWGYGDIVAIGEQQGGIASAQSLTDTTIKSFYLDIALNNKQNAYGHYDIVDKKVYWTHSNGRCLVYDTVLSAFSKLDFGISQTEVTACTFNNFDETAIPDRDNIANTYRQEIQCPISGYMGDLAIAAPKGTIDLEERYFYGIQYFPPLNNLVPVINKVNIDTRITEVSRTLTEDIVASSISNSPILDSSNLYFSNACFDKDSLEIQYSIETAFRPGLSNGLPISCVDSQYVSGNVNEIVRENKLAALDTVQIHDKNTGSLIFSDLLVADELFSFPDNWILEDIQPVFTSGDGIFHIIYALTNGNQEGGADSVSVLHISFNTSGIVRKEIITTQEFSYQRSSTTRNTFNMSCVYDISSNEFLIYIVDQYDPSSNNEVGGFFAVKIFTDLQGNTRLIDPTPYFYKETGSLYSYVEFFSNSSNLSNLGVTSVSEEEPWALVNTATYDKQTLASRFESYPGAIKNYYDENYLVATANEERENSALFYSPSFRFPVQVRYPFSPLTGDLPDLEFIIYEDTSFSNFSINSGVIEERTVNNLIPITIINQQGNSEVTRVLVGNDRVVNNSDRIVVNFFSNNSLTSTLMFVVKREDNSNLLLSFLDDEESGNYYDFSPVEYSSFSETAPVKANLEVGATGFGDLMRNKQAFRVFCYFETKEYRGRPAPYASEEILA